MNHPNFSVPEGLTVAWSPRLREYLVLQGDGPIEQMAVLAHSPDPSAVQNWMRQANPAPPSAAPAAREENPRRHIKVRFEDGNVLETEINGTNADILDYYIGQTFNFGDRTGGDRLVKAVAVEFLDQDPSTILWDVFDGRGNRIDTVSFPAEIPMAVVARTLIQERGYPEGLALDYAKKSNPHHGRKHNGAGLGAFLGSAGAGLLGAAIVGSGAAPLAVLLSSVGGGVGGYIAAPDDRKKRGALGGATGGLLGPLFAALGGWIGGRKPDKHPVRRRNPKGPSLAEAIASNPDAAMSYEDALAQIEQGDVGLAAAWIAFSGIEPEDPSERHITEAALGVLRAAGVNAVDLEVDVVSATVRTPIPNPQPSHAHDHGHDWWTAEGHCCEACAVAKPCSGGPECDLPTTAQANPKRRKKGRR